MRILSWRKDGGSKSTVTGFWLVEIKSLFSIVLLRFGKGSREAFHNHAFGALTWFLSGQVEEHHLDGRVLTWKPSFLPKFTPRSCFHKVYGKETTWALSLRGPWTRTWKEYLPDSDEFVTLSNGRKVVEIRKAAA